MGKDTGIAWCHHTFNPWWGCVKVSQGCKNCYAAREANRFGQGDLWTAGGKRKTFGDKHWNEPLAWNFQAQKEGIRHRVFSGSMCDVFEDHPDLEPHRVRLWSLIEQTPWLYWLILTKRGNNILRMLPENWLLPNHVLPRNIWLGVTVENQLAVNRTRYLRWNSGINFVSVEPMLERVDLRMNDVNWVICGCESGPGARPMQLDWVRELRDQCLAYRVPFFFKQAMIDGQLVREPELDGRQWLEFPAI